MHRKPIRNITRNKTITKRRASIATKRIISRPTKKLLTLSSITEPSPLGTKSDLSDPVSYEQVENWVKTQPQVTFNPPLLLGQTQSGKEITVPLAPDHASWTPQDHQEAFVAIVDRKILLNEKFGIEMIYQSELSAVETSLVIAADFHQSLRFA